MADAKATLPDIQNFDDARSYFNSFIEINATTSDGMTLRGLAGLIPWPFGYLSDVAKGRRQLTPSRALQFAKSMNLSSLATERLMFFALKESRDPAVRSFFDEKIRMATSSRRYSEVTDYSLIEEIEVTAVLEMLKWSRGRIKASELRGLLRTFPNFGAKDLQRILRKLKEAHVIEETSPDTYDVLVHRLALDESKGKSGIHINQSYARNFIRFGDLPQTPNMFNSGFIEVPRRSFMDIAEKLLAVRNWLLRLGDACNSEKKEKLHDTLIFQYDLNLFPIIDKIAAERLGRKSDGPPQEQAPSL